ncbi:hypothetical protein LNP25_12930 [Klebsiella variicola subsp. variicola]|nr:hypothetical protein [Klebsiella variicola subsp. variicola]
MNKPATLTPKAPLLMLVAALALSTSFYAGATPAFLDYAQQQAQAQEEKSSAATAKQASDARQNADNKKRRPITHSCKKNRQPTGNDCAKR